MSHVLFFSYANADKDRRLERFFEDLCLSVRVHTDGLTAKDPRLCFRDGANLPLMVEWRPALMEALQTSGVFVCLTSSSLFASRFCGQEYHVFDQRRRMLNPGGPPPPVILPIVWGPAYDAAGAARVLDTVQWGRDGVDPLYREKGLRQLQVFKPSEYRRCVEIFGEAIGRAYREQKKQPLPRLKGIASFDDIPNAFAGILAPEAQTADGLWIDGPDVANFVLAVGTVGEVAPKDAKYGNDETQWRPYLPPHGHTAAELAKSAANSQGLRFRQIPVDANLGGELAGSQRRKNLAIVVADPASLALSRMAEVSAIDSDPSEGTAVLVPYGDLSAPWGPQGWAESNVRKVFPVRSQSIVPPFQAPICTLEDFTKTLEVTLAKLRSAMTAAGAATKPRTDLPPTGISGAT